MSLALENDAKQKELETIWARAGRVRRVRPARFTFFLHSTTGKWTIPLLEGVSREEMIVKVVEALKVNTFDGLKPMEGSDLMDRTRQKMLGTMPPTISPFVRYRYDANCETLYVDFLTARWQWLDACTVRFKKQLDKNGNLIATFWISSTSVGPLSFKFPVTWGVLFCWFPMVDGYNHTLREISTLKEVIASGAQVNVKQTVFSWLPRPRYTT